MTTTENPTADTAASDAGTISLRHTWPKTKAERVAAKLLIAQAFDLSHTDNNAVNWTVIKAEHPALWEKLIMWAADDMQHIYQEITAMRRHGELPETPYADNALGKNGHAPSRTGGREKAERGHRRKGEIDPKFAVIDKWLLDKHESFDKEGPAGRIQWAKVFDRFPAKEHEANVLWNTNDRGQLRGLLGGRLRQLLKQKGETASKPEAKPEPTMERLPAQGRYTRPHGEESELKKLVHEVIRLGHRPDGVISIATVKNEHPDLWAKIEAFYPDESAYKRVLQRVSYLKKTGNLANILGSTAITPVPQAAREAKGPTVIHAPAEVKASEFRFNCCPLCMLDILSTERFINAKITDCPRCHFQIEKAEQAYVAMLHISN